MPEKTVFEKIRLFDLASRIEQQAEREELIHEFIAEFGPLVIDSMTPRLRQGEIARRAGVSQTAISRAMRGELVMSGETFLRVLDVAEGRR